jgi:exopolysaccharide production protein ExoZ
MIWSVQALRFVAALMVVYVHAAQIAFAATGSSGAIPHSIALTGRAGVDIFFVISGVVIARTAPDMTAVEFGWRRVRRIMPLYLLCCVPALLIAAKTGFGWRDVLATLALWPATDVMTAPLIPVAWTLSFEMLFYAAATLILWHRWWLFITLAGFVLAFFARAHGPVFQFFGNPIIVEFLFGVLIARLPLVRSGVRFLPIGAVALIVSGPLGISPQGGTLDFLTGEENLQRVFVYGIPSALVVYGTMHISAQKSVWTYLGDVSYSLYLVHTFIVSMLLVVWTAFPIQPDLLILLTMFASVAFAWRTYEMVEKPILKALPTHHRS